jgi:hypothetical protein
MRACCLEMQGHEDVREGEAVMATITRNEVASMLGVSVATVRRMEGKSLHPRMVDGAWRFEVDEVKNIQRAPNSVVKRSPSEGEVAAEIFRRFDEGQSLRQIVRECRQPPSVVRILHQEWAAPLGKTSNPESEDSREVTAQLEQEIACWEDEMKALIAADVEWERERYLARVARDEGRLRPRIGQQPVAGRPHARRRQPHKFSELRYDPPPAW